MKNYLRLLACFISAAMICAFLASCGSGTEPESSEESQNASEATTEKIEITTTVEDLVGVPKNNYDCDFNLLIMQDTNVPKYHWVEESENDVLTQAIYARQQRVFDYLGVNIIGTSITNYQEYTIPFKT